MMKIYEGCPYKVRGRIVYHRLMKFCINEFQLSGTMKTQYDSLFLNIDRFFSH